MWHAHGGNGRGVVARSQRENRTLTPALSRRTGRGRKRRGVNFSRQCITSQQEHGRTDHHRSIWRRYPSSLRLGRERTIVGWILKSDLKTLASRPVPSATVPYRGFATSP